MPDSGLCDSGRSSRQVADEERKERGNRKMKSMRNVVLVAFMVTVIAFALPGTPTYASGGGMARFAASGKAPSDQPIGDPALARKEARCAAAHSNAPWFRTLVTSYNFDSARTGLVPCARFPGSMTGPNVVKALKSSSVYYAPLDMATRGPKDLYVNAGCDEANPPALDGFVAKVEPGTLKQVWRTSLSDARQNNEIHLCGEVDSLDDGSLIVTSDHTLYKLNGTTGEIIAKVDLPTGVNPPTIPSSMVPIPSPTAPSSSSRGTGWSAAR